MRESALITDKEKWEAVISCNKDYDGFFFYGVKTTGIFCRPSCKSKAPARENVVFFDSAETAMKEGFRPCKRCCPDKEAFWPALEIVKSIKAVLDENYNRSVELGRISVQLGISINHMERLFKQHIGLTPKQYINRLRVDKASELLKEADGEILDIAYRTGFGSLSNFYRCFKQHTGCTPKEYRRYGGF